MEETRTDRAALQRTLSRVAAAELQGRAVPQGGWTTVAPGGGRAVEVMFKEFLAAARAGKSSDEIIEGALEAVKWRGDPAHQRRTVRGWIGKMQGLERSHLRVAVSPAAAGLNGPWNEPGRRIAEAYTVVEQHGQAALLVPKHVMRWGRDREARLTDLGQARPSDSPAVLETLLGITDETLGKRALESARTIIDLAT